MPGLFDSFSGAVGNFSSIGSAATQAMGTLGTIAGTAAQVSGAINTAQGAVSSISALRSMSLPPGGNPIARFAAGTALFNGAIGQAVGAVGSIGNAVGSVGGAIGALGGLASGTALGGALSSISGALGALGGAFGGGGDGDWRPKLTCALGTFVFPYTPTIGISGGAQYEEVPITHQNYSFFAYQNSKAESITVSGPFFVEDASQAQVWIQSVNFLRAATKMFQDGNPPIIMKFNAYGNYVFKDIPVIVKNYSVDMPNSVDYINTGSSHVPIKSSFSVTLQPIYSREKVKTFNLQSFINGGSAGFV
jgi:hypothetical protein